MFKIGIIGCGGRMSSLLPQLLRQNDLIISAIADPKSSGAESDVYTAALCEKLGSTPAFYPDAQSMLAAESLDGICIATRCSLHTPIALLAGAYGKPFFLEKPVATSWEQLRALEALLPLKNNIVVSFPLRRSAIAEAVKDIIDSGKLGTIEHVQAYNNVYYGRGYYKKWYRDDTETGGLFLQKATHDFDYISYLLGENKPVRVCAVTSKQIFKGNMPAGQKCADCPKQLSCPESPANLAKAGEPKNGEYCCFAVDTGNEDSGSAIVEYESGMHVVYSQNFFVRKSAGKRGARLMGSLGTVEFNFNTGLIEVYYHYEDRHETIKIGITGGHAGGDDLLIDNFANVVRGIDVSRSTLEEGIRSARLCLAARESARTHSFIEI